MLHLRISEINAELLAQICSEQWGETQTLVWIEGGFVLVLRVPASFVGPHRFGAPAAERFVMRTDTKTIDLSYAYLRQAFERGSSLVEQARTFRANRLARLHERQTVPFLYSGPVLAVHIVPLSGLAGRADVDIAGLPDDNRPLMVDNDAMNWRRMTTLDGLVTYPQPDDDGVENLITMFRNGAFETVRKAGWETPVKAVIGELAGMHLRATIKTYTAAAESFSVNGPALVGVAVANAAGMHLQINRSTYTREPVWDKHIVIPDVLVEDIANPTLDVDTICRPLIEVLYQAFGAPRCPYFKSGGNWIGAV